MSFQRWGYEFDGAYTDPDSLRLDSGVYVIWCRSGDQWKVLDAGESDNVRDRVVNHDRANCWRSNCSGIIYYSAAYIFSFDKRREIELYIRNLEKPSCGEF